MRDHANYDCFNGVEGWPEELGDLMEGVLQARSNPSQEITPYSAGHLALDRVEPVLFFLLGYTSPKVVRPS